MAAGVLRQIHLDFHTSDVITAVAEHFDADEFGDTLAAAHVNSINVFGKCGHGYSYYPTTVGTVHPGLKRDLLGEQIEALHARGIKAPVYVSVDWDDLAVRQHPEWLVVDRLGREMAKPPFWGGYLGEGKPVWSTVDLASDYADYVLAQVDEICRLYRPDGFWLDIVSVIPNFSPAGVDRMVAAGVDPEDAGAVEAYYRTVRLDFIRDVERIVHGYVADATIVHNHTTDAWLGETIPWQNQVDVESLPTDGTWGYVHYPVFARYARTFGRPIVGMTGRFHRTWGDFGGLKTVDQLDFEVATILSAGGSPCVGDQLDPSGRLDPAVYRTVGAALGRAEALEPWLAGFHPLAEAAVLAQWSYVTADPGRIVKAPSAGTYGAAQMLLEQSVQFDVVDETNLEPGRYRLIVVPDDAEPDPALVARLDACRAAGAALLSAGRALADVAGCPAALVGPAPTVPSYLRTGALAGAIGEADAQYPYVAYGQASALVPAAGAQALGELVAARFTRSWRQAMSHGQAPVSDEVVGPLACLADGWGHVAAPVFSEYQRQSYWIYSGVVAALLDRLLPDRLLRHDGPPFVEATVHEGPVADGTGTLAVHLTAYQPRRSANAVPRLDRTHPLVGFPVDVRVSGRATAAYLAPGRDPVPFSQDEAGVVRLAPERVDPCTVIAVEYAAESGR